MGKHPHAYPPFNLAPGSRLEFFVFSLLAEMQGRVMQRDAKGKHVKGTGVQLYAIKRDGELKHYPYVQFVEKWMPSGGRLTVPADASLIKSVEDRMIDAYGHALVEIKCKAGPTETVYGMMVDFTKCMLRKQHVQSLMAAVDAYQVEMLNLHGNQLGPEGGMKLAEMLKANTTLTWLECALTAFETMPGVCTSPSPGPPLRVQGLLQWHGRRRQEGHPSGLGISEAWWGSTPFPGEPPPVGEYEQRCLIREHDCNEHHVKPPSLPRTSYPRVL